jgi:hypothetical protein
MPKNPESFINSHANEKLKETVTQIQEHLIGSEVNLYYHGQNIPVILESVNNTFGHATVILKKRTVLQDERILEKGTTMIVANKEITRNPIIKSKIVKAPKETS